MTTDKKGTGLFMVWVDIPSEHEDELNRWYNEEHMAAILADVPGFLDAARYVAVSGTPKYLACYELESVQVVESPAFLRLPYEMSPWTTRMLSEELGLTLRNNAYQQIFPAQVSQAVAQSHMAPALQVGLMDIPPEIEDEFNQWYNTIFVPGFEKVPGCIRGRRYRVVDGEPKYATVYEFEHEGVPQSPEWIAASKSHPQSARIIPQMKNAAGSPGVYRKIFFPTI